MTFQHALKPVIKIDVLNANLILLQLLLRFLNMNYLLKLRKSEQMFWFQKPAISNFKNFSKKKS